jgi:hypothetical protein
VKFQIYTIRHDKYIFDASQRFSWHLRCGFTPGPIRGSIRLQNIWHQYKIKISLLALDENNGEKLSTAGIYFLKKQEMLRSNYVRELMKVKILYYNL